MSHLPDSGRCPASWADRPAARLAAAALLGIVAFGTASAHDLWVETEGQTHTLRYGHERSKHEGERSLPYAADLVKQARCFGKDGKETKAALSAGTPARLTGACAATLFSASSGYWTKTPYGTENKPKAPGAAVIDAWLSFDAVKTLREWSPAFARPLGDGLEIVPTENPLALKVGDKLAVRVFWRAAPRAGVTVAYHGSARGVTAADGSINVRLRDSGFQLLQASIDEPPPDAAKADKAVYATNLGFTLP